MCDYHAFSRDFTQVHKTRGTTRFGTDKDAGPAAWGRRSGPEDAVLLSYLILAVPSQARLTIQPLYSNPSEPPLSDYYVVLNWSLKSALSGPIPQTPRVIIASRPPTPEVRAEAGAIRYVRMPGPFYPSSHASKTRWLRGRLSSYD
jgi:hypothetical protein